MTFAFSSLLSPLGVSGLKGQFESNFKLLDLRLAGSSARLRPGDGGKGAQSTTASPVDFREAPGSVLIVNASKGKGVGERRRTRNCRMKSGVRYRDGEAS